MKDKTSSLNELISSIKERNGKPVNVRVVSATIESLGIRDVDAQNDYGFESIPHLAIHIFEIVKKEKELKNKYQILAENKAYKNISLNAYATLKSKLFIKNYSIGIFHLMPVFFQILSIILSGISLWTFIGFNNLQSTAVVLGVIIGLVTTGGFVQVIGKQVSYYWYNEDYAMTKRTVTKLLFTGIKSLGITFIIIAALNFFIHLYPYRFVIIVFIYSFLIGVLLLVLSPLYTIKQRWMISVSVIFGTLSTLFLFFYTSISIYLVHWIGISLSVISALCYLHFFFKKTMLTKKALHNATPKMMLSVYRSFNYFFYGVLVYAFIFTDRILAWSSTLNRDIPYIVYYEKDYEIGMDLAILVFFLLAGVLEYSISSFSRNMDYLQRITKYNKITDFNKKMLRLYYKHLRIFAISAIIIGLLLYGIITKPWGYEAGFHETLAPISIKVCLIGSFGYLFFTLGVLNVLYLYTLNQHKIPLIGILMAFLINIAVGITLSRIISYEYSVIGMLIGSLFFMLYTTRATLLYFKNLDYYFYAAY
jgi:uncharacterized protein YkuJ